MKYSVFYFESFEWSSNFETLSLRYSFDQDVFFQENFTFEPSSFDFDRAALNRAAFLLWIMAGISYFKAYIPRKVAFASQEDNWLEEAEASFFQEFYYHGLGEFFYVNNLKPFKLDFPIGKNPNRERCGHLNSSVLLPLGGGKDSLVSVDILQKKSISFDSWVLNDYPFFDPMLKKVQADQNRSTKRKIDPLLFSKNKEGAYNGHIPITSIVSFVGVCEAIRGGHSALVFSNEHSASSPNTVYQGMEINHQFSKSLEAEKSLKKIIQEFVHPSFQYFSLLRSMTELSIAEQFCENGLLEKYHHDFASCNRNFSIQKKSSKFFWCGECSKCAFVWVMFSAFAEKGLLIDVFGGNLFQNPQIKKHIDELSGISGHKPLECVGEIEEVQQALYLAQDRFDEVQEWTDKFENPHLDWQKLYPDLVDDQF